MRYSFVLVLTSLACGAIVGCADPPADGLPALEWEGDRVVFGTNLADEVCLGTLAVLDTTVESIELELGLEPAPEKVEFLVLDRATIENKCGNSVLACWSDGRVYSSRQGLEYKRHELVHALVRDRSIPLFDEGIAAALDHDGGCLASNLCIEADLDTLLGAGSSAELSMLDGYAAGADLVHGMLTAYGQEQVLGFITELSQETPPDEVRSLYLEHFGSVLDEDFQAFKRGPFDDHTWAQRGCEGLTPVPSAGDDGEIVIHGFMDCQSPEVVNSFGSSPQGVIEWVFEVTPEQSGALLVSRTSDEWLVLQGCNPSSFGENETADLGFYTPSWTSSREGDTVFLAAGWYSLRWLGDFGSTLNFALTPPCVFEFGGCPAGQQCNIWNECRTQADVPASLGEPCQQAEEAPLVCEAGSRCLGGLCVAECDATRPCDGGQACSRLRTCGAPCSLLEQDCELGFSCMPSSDDTLDSSGTGACVAVGESPLFGSCDARGSECQVGLSCERVGLPPNGVPCDVIDGALGCCVPFCDPRAAEPGCPIEAPKCDVIRDGVVGICRT